MIKNESVNFLNEFILQSSTESLKFGQYPREYSDLKMKVSFGQGKPAKVPWISFTAPGMTVSNGYYPVYLLYKEENILILSYGISETTEYEETWPKEITDKKTKINDFIDRPYRYGSSFIFSYYTPVVNDGKVSFYKNDKELSLEELEEDLNKLTDYYKNNLDKKVSDVESVVSSGLFYMEQQLEDFIIENWEQTELGKKYELIFEEGELLSQQYKTDIGRIDILAKDKAEGNYVVIELKKNQTSDDTIGQILRYMGWILEEKKDSNVKGVIVAGAYDTKLNYATKLNENIDVFLYEVDFKLKEYKKE